MSPDSVLHLVDTVVVRETVSALPETVKIAGRVLSESPRWWLPAALTVFGTLIGALVGALIGARIGARAHYDFNRKLEAQRAEEHRKQETQRAEGARRQFRWQQEQFAAARVVDLLLEFMAALGEAERWLTRAEGPIERSRSTGRSGGTVEAVDDVFHAAERLQSSWNALLKALTNVPGVWDWAPLRTALSDLGGHWTLLHGKFVAVAEAGRPLKELDAGERDSSLPGRLAKLRDALRGCSAQIGPFTDACKQLTVKVQVEMQTRGEPTIVIDDDQEHGTSGS